MRFALSVILTALLTASPAFAAADLEKELMVATGKAMAKMMFGDKRDEARAECEAGRARLSPGAPKYLSAYVEACLAYTVSKFGPHKKPETCPYYQRAIDIWRDNPPPRDNDEIALQYAEKLKQWKDALAENCPSAAAPATAKMAPIVVPEGATVETLEGISYVMPGGWTVEEFMPVGGSAYFENSALKYAMAVEREAANDSDDIYSERETLRSGRMFAWKYGEVFDGYYALYARVKFDDANVDIGISSAKDGPDAGVVDKTTALGIARKLAESMKVLGPRRCISDCGAGTVTPAR